MLAWLHVETAAEVAGPGDTFAKGLTVPQGVELEYPRNMTFFCNEEFVEQTKPLRAEAPQLPPRAYRKKPLGSVRACMNPRTERSRMLNIRLAMAERTTTMPAMLPEWVTPSLMAPKVVRIPATKGSSTHTHRLPQLSSAARLTHKCNTQHTMAGKPKMTNETAIISSVGISSGTNKPDSHHCNACIGTISNESHK